MRLFVSAGEPSGDRILAAVLAGLRARLPAPEVLELRGLGGPLSAAQGLDSLVPLRSLAVNGISDVLRSSLSLWRVRSALLRELVAFRPDRVLLVDYPGMNVPLARAALRRGIPAHYIAPPQLWAYRDPSARRRRLRAALRGAKLQTLFPFEAAEYEPWDPAIRQGHFFDAPAQEPPRGDRILLCPGSRRGVLRRNLPLWLARLRAAGFALDAVDVLVPEFLADEARAICRAGGNTVFPHGRGMPRPYGPTILTQRDIAFSRARAAIAFPGTITLELLLARVPTQVWAVLDAPTLWAGRARLRGPFVALANVLAGREVFPEWIGRAADFRKHPPGFPSPNETWPAVEAPIVAAVWKRMGSDRGVAEAVSACSAGDPAFPG